MNYRIALDLEIEAPSLPFAALFAVRELTRALSTYLSSDPGRMQIILQESFRMGPALDASPLGPAREIQTHCVARAGGPVSLAMIALESMSRLGIQETACQDCHAHGRIRFHLDDGDSAIVEIDGTTRKSWRTGL